MRGYFHADYTDTLYWAYTTVESGHLLNPDFGYAAILPFGSQLWLVPLIAIFGMNYSACVAGMVIFAAVYFASLLYLSHCLELKGGWRMVFVTGMILLLSGSDKLREMMWGHAIYYSLSILFFVLGSALVLNYLKDKFKWSTTVLIIILTTGVALDNAQMIALYFVPLLGAAALERFFSREAGFRDTLTKRLFTLSAVMISATALGLLILYLISDQGHIIAAYAEAYSTFSAPETWLDNFSGVLPNIISLYGIVIEGQSSIVSLDTIPVIVKLCGLLVIMITPVAMFTVYKKIKDRTLRFFLWAHALTSIVIVFISTLGSLGGANWRLIPMLGTAVPTTILSLKWIFDEKGEVLENVKAASVHKNRAVRKPLLWFLSSVRKRFSIVCLAIILLNVILTGQEILRMPTDYNRDNELHTLTSFLKDHQLEYGYADFWNSQAITLLSDNEVRTRCIEISVTGIRKRAYQNDRKWFEDQPGADRYFILMTTNEYTVISEYPEWTNPGLLVDEVLETGTGHVVVVFRQNPWNYLS